MSIEDEGSDMPLHCYIIAIRTTLPAFVNDFVISVKGLHSPYRQDSTASCPLLSLLLTTNASALQI